jgi:hypothetical protein
VRYNGTIHHFVLLNPITDTPAVRSALQQAKMPSERSFTE